MMISKQIVAFGLFALAFSGPALAQQSDEGTPMTVAECTAMFRDADKNGDGVLSQAEIASSDMEGAQTGVTLDQFVSDCAGS